MSRKPNSNAVLKTLPDERQATIAQYARDHSLEETVKWLADDGITTSTGALSNFLASQRLEQRLSRNASVAERLKAEIKDGQPGITPEELDFIGQKFFTELAIDEEDSLAWQRAQNVKIKQGALALESRRIALLEKKAAAYDKASEVLKSTLSPEEQRRRLKEILK